MLADDFIRELHEIRVEVQIFAAIQNMARLDADRAFQALIARIDKGIHDAQQANIHELIAIAKEHEMSVGELNTHRGRYFGAVLGWNETAILASFKASAAHIIPKAMVQSMTGSMRVGSHINVVFESGMCSIMARR